MPALTGTQTPSSQLEQAELGEASAMKWLRAHEGVVDVCMQCKQALWISLRHRCPRLQALMYVDGRMSVEFEQGADRGYRLTVCSHCSCR